MDIRNQGDRFATLVADEIKRIATEREATQLALSRESGISQGQISRLFRHERAISVDQLDALARALGTKASTVLASVERQFLSVVPDILAGPDVEQAAAYGHDLEDDPDPA